MNKQAQIDRAITELTQADEEIANEIKEAKKLTDRFGSVPDEAIFRRLMNAQKLMRKANARLRSIEATHL